MGRNLFLRILFFSVFYVRIPPVFLFAETLKVPEEYATIKSAVYACKDGDVIEVDDGFYLEHNIILDKKIKIRSKNLFGAVIIGYRETLGSIFMVRDEVEISGFILKSAENGIMQRNSRDVLWKAHDLVIIDMGDAGISVNDVAGNIGKADLSKIFVINSRWGVATNDAYGIHVRDAFLVDCYAALAGSNHVYFNANHSVFINCRDSSIEDRPTPVLPLATNKINCGEDNWIYNSKTSHDTLVSERLKSHIESIFQAKNRPKKEREILKSITALILGDIASAQHDYLDAMGYYRKANSRSQKAMSEELFWQTAYRIAKTNERLDKKFEALKAYKETIASIDTVRIALPLSICQPDFFKDKRDVFESLLNLLYHFQLKNPQKGYAEEALYYMEKYRAGFLYQVLSQRNANSRTHLDRALEKEKKAITEQISEIQLRLRESGLTSRPENDISPELEEAEERYRGLFIKRKKEIQNVIRTSDSQPLSYDQIQNKLSNKRIAFLEYFLGEEHSFAIFVSKQKLRLAILTDEGKVREAVDNYLEYLRLSEIQDFQGFHGSQKLLDLLAGPFLDELDSGIEKIVIVPDDHLHYLPFEALAGLPDRSRARKAGPCFLIEDLEISYAPSISGWLATTDYASSYGGLNRLLAIGYSDEHPSRPQNAGLYLPLSSLRFIRQEINAISSLFKDGKPVTLLDEKASEKELKSVDLSGFDIIHLATHGILDNERWWRSFLLLKQNPALKDDGFLSPLEILDLKLNAKLVVLSACQTAKGKLYEGEGILGISQAFLLAGARSVIASLWNINDESSVQIFKGFYRFIKSGESVARALRLSKLTMIKSRFRHPSYWAAFILMENGEDYRNHGQN